MQTRTHTYIHTQKNQKPPFSQERDEFLLSVCVRACVHAYVRACVCLQHVQPGGQSLSCRTSVKRKERKKESNKRKERNRKEGNLQLLLNVIELRGILDSDHHSELKTGETAMPVNLQAILLKNV